MPNTPSGYRRRNSLRHKTFDYTSAGAYFVTIRAAYGRCSFGQVVDNALVLNPLGQIADETWASIAQRRPDVQIDEYVVMPNHVHALLWLVPQPHAAQSAGPGKPRRFGDAIAGSLSALLGLYKSSVAQQAQRRSLIVDAALWQRNFHDHIVRDDRELQRIRDCVRTNPARWLDGGCTRMPHPTGSIA